MAYIFSILKVWLAFLCFKYIQHQYSNCTGGSLTSVFGDCAGVESQPRSKAAPPRSRQSPAPRSRQSPAPRSRQSPAPRSGQSPAPRSGQSPAPRSGQSPAPRSGQSPPPRSRSKSPAPRSRSKSPAPRSRSKSPAPRSRSKSREADDRRYGGGGGSPTQSSARVHGQSAQSLTSASSTGEICSTPVQRQRSRSSSPDSYTPQPACHRQKSPADDYRPHPSVPYETIELIKLDLRVLLAADGHINQQLYDQCLKAFDDYISGEWEYTLQVCATTKCVGVCGGGRAAAAEPCSATGATTDGVYKDPMDNCATGPTADGLYKDTMDNFVDKNGVKLIKICDVALHPDFRSNVSFGVREPVLTQFQRFIRSKTNDVFSGFAFHTGFMDNDEYNGEEINLTANSSGGLID